MKPKSLNIGMKLMKAVEDGGRFFAEGYAAHGDMDTYGDKISEQAMKQLAEGLPGLTVLHNHDPDKEVGKVLEAVHKPDETAVWVKVEIMDSETKDKIGDERINAFSIHAWASEWHVIATESEWVWEILSWDRIVELSVTAVPVNENAKILNHYVASFRRSMEGEMKDKSKDTAKVAAEEAVKKALEESNIIDIIVEKVKKAVGIKTEKAEPTPEDHPVVETPETPAPTEEPVTVVEKTVEEPEEEKPEVAKAVEEKKALEINEEVNWLQGLVDAMGTFASDDEAAVATVKGWVDSATARVEELNAMEADGGEEGTGTEESASVTEGAEGEATKALKKKVETQEETISELKRSIKDLTAKVEKSAGSAQGTEPAAPEVNESAFRKAFHKE